MILSLKVAAQVLWAPREAAREAAGAAVWVPWGVLALAAGFADYPRLFRLGGAAFAQARMDATPEGMFPGSILFYLGLSYAAPLLLPLASWMAGRLLALYTQFVLDVKVGRRDIVRVVAFGFLPLAIERTLVGGLILLCGSSCDPLNPLASNLAFFLNPKETQVFWYEMARSVDLFSVWTIVLLGKSLGGRMEWPASRFLPGLLIVWVLGVIFRAWLLG